ncbi:MAG TPA: hypothetical protein VMW23_02030, partial [Sedimentisphaerales bacterium]|nr:hypothetical protein [Sedimentisphaerales bacterium]
MSAAENVEKLIKKFCIAKKSSVTTSPDMDKRVLDDALAAYEKSKAKKPADSQPFVWRIIMKSKITKLATAAAIIIAVALSVTFLDKTVAPAYAIGQTIEALRQARIVHMFCRDWDGKKFEMWMSLNTEGYPEYCYSYWPDYEVTNISTPTVSYQYNKKMNQVSINKGKLYHFDIRFDNMFENIQEAVLKNENNIKVYREAASSGGKNLIVAICEGDAEAWKIFIDSETKLPVGLHCLKGRNRPGDFIRDFDEIRFDEEPPAGIFEFEMPDGAVVTDMDQRMQLLDDPNNGISAEGLSKQQAAEEIACEYWRYIIEKDLEKAKKVSPSISLYSAEEVEKRYQQIFGNCLPSEFVESGKLYVENSCGLGEILPCILMFEDGRKREAKIIIRFRNIRGKSSCVIAGHYGYP